MLLLTCNRGKITKGKGILMGYVEQLAFSLFGAVMQELIYWYQLRTKLKQIEYRELITSKAYWLVTALMILVGPVGVIVWFYGNEGALTARDYALFGAAFPLVFKAGVGAIADNNNRDQLGTETKGTVKKYLMR
jgi:hypothetical protein